MSDTTNDQSTPTVTEPAVEETPMHPAWEKALAVVPDSLRGGIYEQIRTTERESQAAIERARTQSVPKEWQDFATGAQSNGIDPQQLIDSYNVAQAMQNDPVAFYEQLGREVDAAVASGQLTRAEGAVAKNAAAAQIEQLDGLKTPEQERIDALQAQLDGVTQNMSAREQQVEQERVNQQAQVYYDEFNDIVQTTFENAGFGNATVETKVAVMRMADSALNGDQTDTLSLQQAVEGAFNSLIAFRNAQPGAAAAAAPQAGQILRVPVGGGSSAIAAPEPVHFGNDLAGKKSRHDAMMEEAKRQFSS